MSHCNQCHALDDISWQQYCFAASNRAIWIVLDFIDSSVSDTCLSGVKQIKDHVPCLLSAENSSNMACRQKEDLEAFV